MEFFHSILTFASKGVLIGETIAADTSKSWLTVQNACDLQSKAFLTQPKCYSLASSEAVPEVGDLIQPPETDLWSETGI